HTLDRAKPGAVGLKCGNQARVNELSVHQHRARSALSLATTFLCPCQMKVLTQYIQQALHRRHIDPVLLAVHRQLNLGVHAFTSGRNSPCLSGSSSLLPPCSRSVKPLTFSKMSSGSNGIESKLRPVAFSIAFKIAGAGPSIGNSPIPLAPPGPCTQGTSSK